MTIVKRDDNMYDIIRRRDGKTKTIRMNGTATEDGRKQVAQLLSNGKDKDALALTHHLLNKATVCISLLGIVLVLVLDCMA